MKDKIGEINQIKEMETNEIKDKLAALHTTDIQGLKYHHENEIEALQGERLKLNDII